MEQWLPHSTWYLMALATRYDEKSIEIDSFGSAIPKSNIAKAQSFDVRLQGRTLAVNAAGVRASSVELFTLNGSKIASSPLTAGKATLKLDNVQSGIYMVKVNGLAAKKIAIK